MEKHMEGAEYNKAKELLAYELTKLVHGKEEADKADAAAKAIFAGGGNSDDMPSTTIAAADLTDGKIGILTLLVKCGLCPSNGEARRLVTQNGIAVNGEKFTDPKGLVDLSEPVVIKRVRRSSTRLLQNNIVQNNFHGWTEVHPFFVYKYKVFCNIHKLSHKIHIRFSYI